MGKFSQEEFNHFIIDNRVIGFKDTPFTLKSGRKSHWYVNWRTVAEDAFLLDRLSDLVLAFSADLVISHGLGSFDCFYGVPEGATKLGVLCQFKYARSAPSYGKGSHVMPMGRAKPKEHGDPKDKYFVGVPKGNTIILEDVTTTGGSLLTAIDGLIESEIPVIAALGLTNRMEKRDDGKTVPQAIGDKQSKGRPVQYFSLSSAVKLLPQAAKIMKPSREILQSIEAEFREYGETGIEF